MMLDIDIRFSYGYALPTDVLVQIEVARIAGQEVIEDALFTTPVEDFARIGGESALGTRAWMQVEGQLDLTYTREGRGDAAGR